MLELDGTTSEEIEAMVEEVEEGADVLDSASDEVADTTSDEDAILVDAERMSELLGASETPEELDETNSDEAEATGVELEEGTAVLETLADELTSEDVGSDEEDAGGELCESMSEEVLDATLLAAEDEGVVKQLLSESVIVGNGPHWPY